MLKENHLYNKENKIKLTDFENIYNNKSNGRELNSELLQLYNKRIEIENNYYISWVILHSSLKNFMAIR